MKHILVIGDLIIDEYICGEVERLCQEAPVPILSIQQKKIYPGGAGNVSLNVAKANIPVNLLTVVGNDPDSSNIYNILEEQNVDMSMSIIDTRQHANKKIRYVSSNYILLRADVENQTTLTSKIEKEILEKIKIHINKFDSIILSDYNKGLLTKKLVKNIIQISKEYNIKVFIDVKGDDTEKYLGAFLLKPNLKELFYLTKMKIDTNEDIIKAASYLCKKCSSKYVLVTLSDKGMILVSDTGFNYAIEGKQCSNPHVIGAGDTTIAYVAAGFYHNLEISEIIKIANTAAGLAVLKPMTSSVTYKELKNHHVISPCTKLLGKAELQDILKFNKGKKIVFTNGCFDILHLGHMNLLYEASKQGDILFVAVDTDESVKKIKGLYRPIQPFDIRVATLSLLEYVDYILSFDTNELLQLIELIHPDVIVKGDDYENRDFRGSQLVKSWGGQVHIVKNKYNNSSTSDIIQSILNKFTDGNKNEKNQ